MTLKRSITLSVILAGSTAMATQIIFTREFLVVFYGNEISIGIILASWLIWGAFGSSVLGRFSDRIRTKVRVFSICQFALAITLPITLLFARVSKVFMGVAIGEIMGYAPMIVSTFVILSVPCAIMGFMFSLACRIYHDATDNSTESIARVYIAEAIGALSGGLLVSYFLIRFLDSFSILFLLSFLNLAASVWVQQLTEPSRAKKIILYATVTAIISGTLVMFLGCGSRLRQFSREKLWSGFNVLESKNSYYGNITVTKKGDQRSFYQNGLHLYTVPDLLSAEESVHFALLEQEAPRDVLLIGGGVGGLLEEILKHPVRKLDYVELDPEIIRMAKKHLNAKDSSFIEHPKVNVINKDGRFFVKTTRSTYDCIIINLGDPYTAQLNRFYTVGFFQELSRILNDNGVISFALTSSANYISKELADYLRSVYLSVREVFPDVLVIPGDTAYFLASNTRGALTHDSKVLTGRIAERGIDTKYVRDYYLFDKLSDGRIEYAKNAIEKNVRVEINRDFKPISYYYATVFWGTHFEPLFRRVLHLVTKENIWLVSIFFCILSILFCILGKTKRKKKTVLLAVMTTGFTEINFQIAVILAFQIIYGFVFYKLGIIFTSFMVGLAFGGWVISRNMDRIRKDMSIFSWTQGAICIYPLILPVTFLWLSKTQSGTVSWLGANLILPFLPAVAGFIGGIQFPLANKICLVHKHELGRTAGLSYGLDLLGACAGSFLAAAFLIPILGIFGTCFLAAMINVTILAALLLV